LNLDFRQAEAKRGKYPMPDIPVIYITQFLGLALGLKPADLGLDALTVSADALVRKSAALSGTAGGRS
jgi:heterodisulfide reductase subunit B